MANKNKKSRVTNNNNKNNNNSREEDEISKLKKQIIEFTPESGIGLSSNSTTSNPNKFTELPISKSTILGLHTNNKTILTDIQSATILHSLAGRDILACAQTGSGKTIAYLIPLLERLYREHITSSSNIIGGIILSPTRELATQIFNVLRTIGKYHSNISAGILIGGKKEFYKEQAFLERTNIIVATPGRLLQHLEQSTTIDVSGVEMLILDEADRILDMGFRVQLERILEYIPKNNDNNRQTLLFSATQTRKVKDLAKLSLKNPEYIFIHSSSSSKNNNDNNNVTTNSNNIVSSLPPSQLEQLYMVIPLEHKLDLLFSFLKSRINNQQNNNKNTSIIVFFSTCSQVQHAHTLFCALRPGISILALHGKLKQEKRGFIYQEFLQKSSSTSLTSNNNNSSSNGVVLFCTDIASRGLDFPNISWVISLDAPDSREDYIHRVGRTARYQSKGKSIVFLLPSEEQPFLQHLKQSSSSTKSNSSSITLKKMNINPKKAFRISTANIAGSILAKHTDSALYAKKAFQSYLRCYSLMPHEDIFDITKLPCEKYALSLGLPHVPSMSFLDKIKGMTRDSRRKVKNENKKLKQLKEEIQMERLAKKKRKVIDNDDNDDDDNDDDDDDFLSIKHNQNNDYLKTTINENDTPSNNDTRKSKKIKFDDDGHEIDKDQSLPSTSYAPNDLPKEHDTYLNIVKERLQQSKDIDVKEEKERIRSNKLKYKLKEKAENSNNNGDDSAGVGAQLAVYDYENEDSSSDSSNSSDDSSSSDDDDESDSSSDSSTDDSDSE